MLERYKLRLRDGTVLVVDHDALSSWLVDGRAMVQPVGSERWLPLKTFLAKERRDARSAAFLERRPDPELPLTPPPPRSQLPPTPPPPPPPPAAKASPPTPEEEVSSPVPVAEEPDPPPPPDLSSASAPEPPVDAEEPPEVWVPSEEAAVLSADSFPSEPENAASVAPVQLLDEEDVT